MANPADDLYEIFQYWRKIKLKNGHTPSTKVARFLTHSNADTQDRGWLRQREAARLLEAISLIIDEMEKSGDPVEAEREYFKEWAKAVYAYPGGWDSSGAGISDSALNTLGMFRNSARRFVPELKDEALEELKQLLAEEPDLVPPPGTYPYELYDYFTRVRGHLKNCIDEYSATKTFDLYKAAEDYRAAVFMMANGLFTANPADWMRHGSKTFLATQAKKFGNDVAKEGQDQLVKRTVSALAKGATRLALEAGNMIS